MKKFLISLGLVCALVFGAFADEVADADIEAQNDAIAAEQEAAQNEEAAEEVAEAENEGEEAVAEETADGETVAEETPAEEAAEEAEPTENTEEPAVAEGDNGEAEAEPVAEETVEQNEGEDIAAAETDEGETVTEEAPAEEVAENAETEEEQTETAETSLPSMGDIAEAAGDIADAAIDAAAGVAEEELNALIASFPKGTWIDSKYNAAWVFADDGTLTVQNAKNGKVYFTFSLNKINSYSVMPTANGIAVSFVCGETKRQYTFTKSNDDDYNMTLQIQAKWLKGGYTAQMSKKQDIGVGKN